MPREPHNSPLHLFSASPDPVGFGQSVYRQRSAETSLLLGQLFERLRGKGFAMSFTMEDFNRQYTKEHFSQLALEEQCEALDRLSPEHRRDVLRSLPVEERRDVLRSLPPKELLATLSQEQIREYLDRLTSSPQEQQRRSRRKKEGP